MEIKIIINESGPGRGPRRLGQGGRHMGRAGWMGGERGHRRHADHSQGRHGDSEMPAERGRVIGKVVEMPDGRVKIIGRGGPEMVHRSRRHGGEDRRESRFSGRYDRHQAGGRHGAPAADDEGREARRARRRLAREIVRALEESGFGEFGKA